MLSRTALLVSKHNNNKHNSIFYKIWKQKYSIKLTKKRLEQEMKNQKDQARARAYVPQGWNSPRQWMNYLTNLLRL